jgi:hypothetical protein
MRAAHRCGALSALAALVACGHHTSQGGLPVSGVDISCGPSTYISNGACVGLPPFSDASVPFDEGDASTDGGEASSDAGLLDEDSGPDDAGDAGLLDEDSGPDDAGASSVDSPPDAEDDAGP